MIQHIRKSCSLSFIKDKLIILHEDLHVFKEVAYRSQATRHFEEICRRGDFSQKITKKSAISDKSSIYAKNCLEIHFIIDFLAIFSEKSPLSLQRDLTAQITPVLIQRPDLNPNGNKETQRPDCFQIVIQRPKLNFNGNLRFQLLFWPKFRL